MLRVAGWPPLDKGPLLRPVIDWMFPYQTWCKQLIRRLGLADHVQYTGPLDAAAMRQAYLDADLFLLPSYSENSPNSLGCWACPAWPARQAASRICCKAACRGCCTVPPGMMPP